MSSVTRAMLWEFWRLSRLELLTRLGYTCGFIVLIWSMVRFTKSEQIPVQFVTSISMVFVFCGAAFSSAVVKIENSDVGSVFQLGFSRPVSTRSLVVWRLIFLAVTGAVRASYSRYDKVPLAPDITIVGAAVVWLILTGAYILLSWDQAVLNFRPVAGT